MVRTDRAEARLSHSDLRPRPGLCTLRHRPLGMRHGGPPRKGLGPVPRPRTPGEQTAGLRLHGNSGHRNLRHMQGRMPLLLRLPQAGRDGSGNPESGFAPALRQRGGLYSHKAPQGRKPDPPDTAPGPRVGPEAGAPDRGTGGIPVLRHVQHIFRFPKTHCLLPSACRIFSFRRKFRVIRSAP